MMILVTYDVNTIDKLGQKRLRQVAKCCQNYGQRVQNSVFECLVEPAEYESMKNKLIKIIDKKKDSLRFYELGSNWKKRVVHIGSKEIHDIEGLLIV